MPIRFSIHTSNFVLRNRELYQPKSKSSPNKVFGTHRCTTETIECLDRMIVVGEAHLRRILGAYAAYYNESRTHRSLNKDAPFHRAIERLGAITSHPILGGLHHQYCRI